MRVFLFLLACLTAFAGVAVLLGAKSAIHEIEAFVLFLIGAVLLGSAAIVESVSASSKRDALSDATAAQASSDILAALRALAPKTAAAALPAQPEIVGDRYFINNGGESSGPFPVEKLRALRNRGVIDDNTPVTKEGDKTWKKLGDVAPA